VSVRVKIFHAELQRVVNGPGEVRVEGTTVGECLRDLIRRYPEAERLMFDANGELQKRFYVFVNQESMFKAGFDQPVTDKDNLILVVLATAG
jgi:molybdopterin converting factor small subunit